MNYHCPWTLSFMENKNTSASSNPGSARSSVSADTWFNTAFALGALVNVIVKCGNTYKPWGLWKHISTTQLSSIPSIYQLCACQLWLTHIFIAAPATSSVHATHPSTQKRRAWLEPAHPHWARLSATFKLHMKNPEWSQGKYKVLRAAQSMRLATLQVKS